MFLYELTKQPKDLFFGGTEKVRGIVDHFLRNLFCGSTNMASRKQTSKQATKSRVKNPPPGDDTYIETKWGVNQNNTVYVWLTKALTKSRNPSGLQRLGRVLTVKCSPVLQMAFAKYLMVFHIDVDTEAGLVSPGLEDGESEPQTKIFLLLEANFKDLTTIKNVKTHRPNYISSEQVLSAHTAAHMDSLLNKSGSWLTQMYTRRSNYAVSNAPSFVGLSSSQSSKSQHSSAGQDDDDDSSSEGLTKHAGGHAAGQDGWEEEQTQLALDFDNTSSSPVGQLFGDDLDRENLNASFLTSTFNNSASSSHPNRTSPPAAAPAELLTKTKQKKARTTAGGCII